MVSGGPWGASFFLSDRISRYTEIASNYLVGLFDLFYSSCELEEFTSIQCQTKSMESEIGGTLSQFWLAPNGILYVIDYSHTSDFIEIGPEDPRYDKGAKASIYRGNQYRWQPNGNHGRVRFYPKTDFIEIYPDSYVGGWENSPIARLHFLEGVLQGYCISTKGKGFDHSEF
jgi:hypothetical protein